MASGVIPLTEPLILTLEEYTTHYATTHIGNIDSSISTSDIINAIENGRQIIMCVVDASNEDSNVYYYLESVGRVDETIYAISFRSSKWETVSFEADMIRFEVILGDIIYYGTDRPVFNTSYTPYVKPGTGIPASDLASGVIPDVSGFYTKPAGDIPASDLASGVIPAADIF